MYTAIETRAIVEWNSHGIEIGVFVDLIKEKTPDELW